MLAVVALLVYLWRDEHRIRGARERDISKLRNELTVYKERAEIYAEELTWYQLYRQAQDPKAPQIPGTPVTVSDNAYTIYTLLRHGHKWKLSWEVSYRNPGSEERFLWNPTEDNAEKPIGWDRTRLWRSTEEPDHTRCMTIEEERELAALGLISYFDRRNMRVNNLPVRNPWIARMSEHQADVSAWEEFHSSR